MKKNNENSLDKGIVTTLTNLILFENSIPPAVNEGKFLQLSPNFLKCVTDTSSNESPVESDYFIYLLGKFYAELNNFKKKLVRSSMFSNNDYMTGMMFIFMLDKDLFKNDNVIKNQALFYEKFISEMNKSESSGIINIYILRFF